MSKLVTEFNKLNLTTPAPTDILLNLEHLIDSRNRIALKLPVLSIEEFRLVSSKDKYYTQEKIDELKALPPEEIKGEFESVLVQLV
jgi:hypothetical protein